jgi:hypothetical protein
MSNSENDISMEPSNGSSSDNCLDPKKCDVTMIIFYVLLLILTLILVGNLVQTGTRKALSWTLFSFVIVFGLIAMFFIFKGGKLKKIGVPIIALVNMLMLLIAMIMAHPTAPFGEKFGAHIANILVAVAVCVGVFLTKK